MNNDSKVALLLELQTATKPMCVVHDDKPLVLIEKGATVNLSCPMFPACLYKIAFSNYSGPCHGCYEEKNFIQKEQMVSMLNFWPYCGECSKDAIIQVMAEWGRDFEVDFSQEERTKGFHVCSVCDKNIFIGPHVVQKKFPQRSSFYHFSPVCAGYDDPELNPNGELLDLATKFQNYLHTKKSLKRSCDESAEGSPRKRFSFPSRLAQKNQQEAAPKDKNTKTV